MPLAKNPGDILKSDNRALLLDINKGAAALLCSTFRQHVIDLAVVQDALGALKDALSDTSEPVLMAWFRMRAPVLKEGTLLVGVGYKQRGQRVPANSIVFAGGQRPERVWQAAAEGVFGCGCWCARGKWQCYCAGAGSTGRAAGSSGDCGPKGLSLKLTPSCLSIATSPYARKHSDSINQ